MAEGRHLKPSERSALAERFRRHRTNTLPSPSSMVRFLEGFVNAEEEAKRGQGCAFIPAPNAALSGLMTVNAELVRKLQEVSAQEQATIDMDATVVETYKQDALMSYKGCRAYQPMNVYWAEQGVVVRSEFRDGNVPAGHEQRRVLEETLAQLPEGVERVYMRAG